MKPTWNVFVANFNDDRPESFNIFDHHFFREDCNKAFAECKHDITVFAEEVKNKLMYYYWSKCEWELVIKGFVGNKKERKVDVYEQVMLNWDKFVDYLWEWYKKGTV